MDNDKIVEEVMKEHTKKRLVEVFKLDLDAIFEEGYCGGIYPEKDVYGAGHYGTCLLKEKKDYKKRFLLEMAERFEKHGIKESFEK